MATLQRIAHGATTEWSTDGTNWSSIAEVKAIAVPTVNTDYQDATSLDSPNGFREYVPGLKDAGEISIPAGYTTAIYTAAAGYQAAQNLLYFRTTLPLEEGQSTTGDVFAYRGYVTPQLEQNAAGDIIAMTLSVRTSGDVTFTAGS